ncbi:MAG: hypothetical protein AAGG68_03295 [Bacteroidota bacterium]
MNIIKWNLLFLIPLLFILSSCQETSNSIETFGEEEAQEFDMLANYAKEIEAANVQKEPSFASYHFVGKGALQTSLSTLIIEEEEVPYLKLQYNGSKGELANTELYFYIGVDENTLPTKMKVEIAFLGDQLIVKDLSSNTIYAFGSDKLDNGEFEEGSFSLISTNFVGASIKNPNDLAKSNGCGCLCVTFSVGGIRRPSCRCNAPSCDSWCIVSCNRSYNAYCYNNCAIE